ncbi:dual specificity tyrosine-phosphorylation-regulated kinase 2-like isoform X3 [Manis pentadactyla]|uniref:dual specificity tyrosine-phosphorylation-regulated kinase 2-like isoform X3 n=1 Tax=Manis pentadactyla TaxID=143292 RepID=UPI00255C5DA9|nr:dual specificity tyrosine-phosphorylation-regulated kinase 2-like isoform X3 [Manis pentadactyla]XP_057342573.1 dual specificity tyrosine-phosphorylation-regulated kinase 2-like isoform X3 [Manis pentadactyla]XP_057352771.1 dual specificity tyrosine-phosphorylation-regulated kinase 2-like isoform X3 [Manis pentadactyla]
MLTRKPSAAAPAAYPTGQGGDSAIHQLQSSPGARRGAPRTGVGTGPPSPIALPPLRASNAAAAAHTRKKLRHREVKGRCSR